MRTEADSSDMRSMQSDAEEVDGCGHEVDDELPVVFAPWIVLVGVSYTAGVVHDERQIHQAV